MESFANFFTENFVQCWGCEVFDRLFQIVSNATALIYDKLVWLCIITFSAVFTVFVINAVHQNIKGGGKDPWYEKSIQKVIINSIVAMGILGMGITVPRVISQITFEPVAQIAVSYTQALIQQDTETINERVTYQPMDMDDTGVFRPQLRDKIILMMKTTTSAFQSYIKLGIAVMDSAFSWEALLGIGALVRHIMIFFIGLYLFYAFFKLFIRYCFYFVDITVAMAFFVFFFPLSVMLMSFNGAEHLPAVVKNIGNAAGKDQIKKLINAIVALAACVMTYTVMLIILARFFTDTDVSSADFMNKILSGDVFEANISDENMAALTLVSATALVYVLNFIFSQIPQVTKMILSAFNVSEEKQMSEQLADDAINLTKNIANTAIKVGKTIVSGSEEKK